MMKDLISRQDAIDAIFNADLQIYEGDCAVGRRNFMTKEEACAIIDSLPSAQPERKKGKWIDIWDRNDSDISTQGRCNRCKQVSDRPLGNFCKWCGADMRGDLS